MARLNITAWPEDRARLGCTGVRAAHPSSIPDRLACLTVAWDFPRISASRARCYNGIVAYPSPTKSVDFGDLKKDAIFRSECSCRFVCTWVMCVGCVCWVDLRVYEQIDERHSKKYVIGIRPIYVSPGKKILPIQTCTLIHIHSYNWAN